MMDDDYYDGLSSSSPNRLPFDDIAAGLDDWMTWASSPIFAQVPSSPLPPMSPPLGLMDDLDALDFDFENSVNSLRHGLVDDELPSANSNATAAATCDTENNEPIRDKFIDDLFNSILNQTNLYLDKDDDDDAKQRENNDDDEDNQITAALKLLDHDYCKKLDGNDISVNSENSVTLLDKRNTITLTYGDLSDELTVSQVNNLLIGTPVPGPSSAMNADSVTHNKMGGPPKFFQLTTEQDLTQLDLYLATDAEFRKTMGKRFLDQGGRCGKDNLRRALRYLMTDKLATNLNWAGVCGRLGKRPFKKFTWIVSTLIDSIMTRHSLTVLELEDVIKCWLKQAPYRIRR